MAISVECRCGKRLSAPDVLAGLKARCSACGAVVEVPRTAATSTNDSLWDLAQAEEAERHGKHSRPPPEAVRRPTAEPPARASATAAASVFEPVAGRRRRRRHPGPIRIGYVSALWYPVTGAGLLVILADGTILALTSYMAVLPVPCLPLIMWCSTLFVLGHLGIFYMEVLHFTVFGIPERPRLPEISYESFHQGLFWWLTMLAAALPWFMAEAIAAGLGYARQPAVWLPMVAVGVLYQPMAVLGLVVRGSFWALLPTSVADGIGRIAGPYLMLWFLAFGGFVGLGALAYSMNDVPLVGRLVPAWLGIYGTAVLLRLLGAMYFNNSGRFRDWE